MNKPEAVKRPTAMRAAFGLALGSTVDPDLEDKVLRSLERGTGMTGATTRRGNNRGK